MTLNDTPNSTLTAQSPRCRPLVLLIEEDIRQQLILQAQLQDLQCEIHPAAGYKGALLLIKQHHYDLIFIGIDEVLGSIDVDALIDAIREGSLNKQTPIAIIGFNKLYKTIPSGEGIDAVLVKPFTNAAGLELLTQWVPGYQAKKGEET